MYVMYILYVRFVKFILACTAIVLFVLEKHVVRVITSFVATYVHVKQ